MKKMVLVPYDQYLHSSFSTNSTSPSVGDGEKTTLDRELILLPFGKCHKKQAESLLTYVERNISWNSKGEIIVNGEVVLGSHITDLLKDALFNYKHFNPVGVKQFYESLKAVPSSLIKNLNRRALIGRGELSSKDDHPLPPPGIPVGRPAIDLSVKTKSLKKEIAPKAETAWLEQWKAL